MDSSPGAQEFDDREAVADGGVLLVAEDRPDLVARAARPALAGAVDLPAAVHPQVGVERQAALQPGEQVFAARRHVQDLVSGQIGRGVRRDAQVGHGQRPAGAALRAAGRRCGRRSHLRACTQHAPARPMEVGLAPGGFGR